MPRPTIAAVIQHDDLVGVLHGWPRAGYTMNTVMSRRAERPVALRRRRVGGVVQRAGAVVQDQDLRLAAPAHGQWSGAGVWPPDRFRPPCSTSARPDQGALPVDTNSAACAVSSAAHSSASVAFLLPQQQVRSGWCRQTADGLLRSRPPHLAAQLPGADSRCTSDGPGSPTMRPPVAS